MTHMHDQNMSNFFFFMFGMCDSLVALNMTFFLCLYIYLAKIFFTVVFVYAAAAAFRLKHSSSMFG